MSASNNLTSNEKSLLTDLTTIIGDTVNTINDYKTTLDNLAIAAMSYNVLYEKYIDLTLYDATRLKDKMKEMIVKAVSDEL